MTDLSVAYIYGESLQITKKHAVRLVLLLLCVNLISTIVSALTMPMDYWSNYMEALQGDLRAAERMGDVGYGTMAVSYLVQCILGIIFFTALVAGPIGLIRGVGERPGLSWFKLPAMTYVKVLIYACFMAVVTVIGLAFIIVPGVYLAIRLWQGFYYLVENPEKGVMEAVSWSWKATSGHVLELLGLIMVFVLAMVALFVGLLIFMLIGGALTAVSMAAGVAVIVLSGIAFFATVLFADAWYYLMAAKTYTALAEGGEDAPKTTTEYNNEPEI